MFLRFLYLLISKFFQIVPISVGLFIGQLLGDFAYYVIRIRRKVVMQNLRLAFGNQKVESELREIAKQTYQNFGMTLIEFILLPKLTKEYITKYIKIENKEYLDNFYQQNRSAIFVTGHLDNWELMGATYTCLLDYPVTVYARRIKSAIVNEYVYHHRTSVGMKVISKKIATREVIKALRTNQKVAFLIDQDAGKNGIFVSFFGKPASTFQGAAAFAVRTGTPILPMFINRDNKAYHTVHIEQPLYPNPNADEESEMIRLTQICTCLLENYILQYPAQYFWFHRRWKTQPIPLTSES